jgi:hypothetical protein
VIACVAVLAQQPCAHPSAAIWLAIGQVGPVSPAIGHPAAQTACIPVAHGKFAKAGVTASSPIMTMETSLVIRFMP